MNTAAGATVGKAGNGAGLLTGTILHTLAVAGLGTLLGAGPYSSGMREVGGSAALGSSEGPRLEARDSVNRLLPTTTTFMATMAIVTIMTCTTPVLHRSHTFITFVTYLARQRNTNSCEITSRESRNDSREGAWMPHIAPKRPINEGFREISRTKPPGVRLPSIWTREVERVEREVKDAGRSHLE